MKSSTKREQAEARQKIYDSLSAEEIYVMLDNRPGNSARERERVARNKK